jgi:hypothetical protein
LVHDIRFYREAIVKRWRDALLDYLAMALDAGPLSAQLSRPELTKLIKEHRNRWWSAKVGTFNSKGASFRYISRYLRRPPLADYRLLASGDYEVCFLTKDKKLGRTRHHHLHPARVHRPPCGSSTGSLPARGSVLWPACATVDWQELRSVPGPSGPAETITAKAHPLGGVDSENLRAKPAAR